MISLFQGLNKMVHPERKWDNITSVVFRLLKKYRIKVTYTCINEYIKSHPNYPSLKSICDFLNEINIINYAIRIDETDLYDFPVPFIAHSKDMGGKILIIYSVDKDQIVFADSLSRKRTMNTRKFLDHWDEVIIVIEPTQLSGDTDYYLKRNIEITHNALLPLTVLIICLVAISGTIRNKPYTSNEFGLYFTILFLGHIIGLTFSMLILRQELDLSSKFTCKLCNIGSFVNCDAVTKSKVSKIFGKITWADVGVIYFSGGLLSLFSMPLKDSICTLSFLAILTLPIPILSISYQWFKISKLCPLCLSVQFVIILESIAALTNYKHIQLDKTQLLSLLNIFLAVFLITLLLKFLIMLSRERDEYKLEVLKVKHDPEVFLYKLKKGERIEIPEGKYALLFGDTQSKVLLKVFLSFHCSACAKEFYRIMKLINHNCRIGIQIIFSPTQEDLENKLIKTVLELNRAGEKMKALEEIKKWYQTDRKSRANVTLIDYNHKINDDFEGIVDYNSLLFSKLKGNPVPSIYVNGYLLPHPYSMEDIKYHINVLEEIGKEEIGDIFK